MPTPSKNPPTAVNGDLSGWTAVERIAGTTIWLNTDQNTATGHRPFDSIGADYNVTFDASGTPYVYSCAAGQNPVSAMPPTPVGHGRDA